MGIYSLWYDVFLTCCGVLAMSGDSLPQKHLTMCPSIAVPFTETMAWAALSWEENLKNKDSSLAGTFIKLKTKQDRKDKVFSLLITHSSTEVETNITEKATEPKWVWYWLALLSYAMWFCWHLEARCCNRSRQYLMKEYPFSGKTRISIIWPNGEKVWRIKCSERIIQ